MEKRSNTDNAKLNETISKIADGKLSKNTIEAAKKGDTNAVMQSLNEADRKKMKEILSDNEKIKNILNSEAAKNIMKILGGDKKNG